MKLFELFNPKLTEAMSSVLFYSTTFGAAKSILSNNTLKGNDGISFTRSLQGMYHKNNKIIGVIFNFDGDKFNQKYKGGPVGTENFTADMYDYDPDDRETWPHQGRDNGQMEDRLQTKQIDNVTNYIRSAIMYLPAEYIETNYQDEFGEDYNSHIEHVEDVANLLNKYSIPVRYVTSEKALTNPKADDKEGFRKLISKMQGVEEEEYVIKYSIYRGEGEHAPVFDERKISYVTTNIDLAMQYARKSIPFIAKQAKANVSDIDLIGIRNTVTGDTY